MTPTYELAGLPLETPLVNAAGSINGTSSEQILREVETLARTAIGAITVGSFTIPEQAGNEARFGGPVYYYDAAAGATYNAMGLPNIGLAAAKSLMPEIIARAHDGGKPVIASVSATHATAEIGNTFEQTNRLVYELLLTGVDLVEVNASCPNLVSEDGTRKPVLGYDLAGMHQLVTGLAPWTGTLNSKVGVKLPPYMSSEEIALVPELATCFTEKPVFGFATTANTVLSQVAKDALGRPVLSVPGGQGGMSGPVTRHIGRAQLQLWKYFMGNNIDIMSTLGVDSGQELAVRRRLGAAAAGGVSFLWNSPNWGRAVTDLLTEWTAQA